MIITCDDKNILPTAIPTLEGINSLYEKKNGSALQYIEGSATKDTLRYGRTEGKLPFEFTFTDRFNHKWKFIFDKLDDDVTLLIPCGAQMLWYGADESPTRTGSDAQTNWAQVQFSYQAATLLWPFHEGVRIGFNAYKDNTMGEWKVDTERWTNVLNMAKKGTEVTGAVLEQVEKGVKLYATGGVA